VHQIDVADVLYFHADDKYTCVRTAAAEHLIRTTITELAAQLDPGALPADPSLDDRQPRSARRHPSRRPQPACSCGCAAGVRNCR
jgi:hypothetical protein